MKRWDIILFLFSFQIAYSSPSYEADIWQYGEDYFAMKPMVENGKIMDVTISGEFSLKDLSKSQFKYESELKNISNFLKEFAREVDRHPSKIEFNNLNLKRNKILLSKNNSIDRSERKKLGVSLSQIATSQSNLLISIDKWKRTLANAYQIIVRLSPNGQRLSTIEFIRPSRAFFERLKSNKSLMVKYSP